MTDHGITPISGVESIALGRTGRPAPALQLVPSEPPAALADEYHAAARVIEELAARQINLHFEVDEDANRVRVQVLDQHGDVIREIPARSLLDSLSGGGLIIDHRS
ncbi:MAG TPA: flagellar protein FlaG [Gaiellales bacterium]|nr:flagellar protein FlaG [Gaiellales bacterium]